MLKWVFLLILALVVRTQAAADQEVSLFQQGLQDFRGKSYDQSIARFTQALSEQKILKDYILLYRAQAFIALKRWNEAQKDLQDINNVDSHFKLILDSRLFLAQVFFELKRPAEVKPLFTKLLRKVRHTEDEPKVLFMMAKSDRLAGTGKGCKYLLQLYKKFPDDPSVQHWDADLDKNEFLGSPTECKYDLDDFRERMRALLWGGLDN